MALSPRDALAANKQAASKLVQNVGLSKTRRILEDAERDLLKRMRQAVKGPGDKSFTNEQLKATLAQVREVTRGLGHGIKAALVDTAGKASEHAATGVIDYLTAADKAYRGVGRQPLALDEARVMDSASEGARASVLRRLASSGEAVQGADEVPHPAKEGILERYGTNVIGNFEETLQRGLLTRKSWDAMREEITAQSPFLEGAPASWAERIVRTESMGAFNRAAFESMREADEQLEDLVRILSATLDDRTGPDSKNVHGMMRRSSEAFEYVDYKGAHSQFQHPPNRSNDREVVIPHRLSWGHPPANLRPLPDGVVIAAYARAKQKFHGRPAIMSTIPARFFRV